MARERPRKMPPETDPRPNGNGGKARADISNYGQKPIYPTWRRARTNLVIRGLDGQIVQGDTFHNDRHPDLILANPPFNIPDWGGERLRDDRRWQYGAPPAGNGPGRNGTTRGRLSS